MASRRAAKRLTPAELLFSQGFGTRRECAALVASGMLEIEGIGTVDDDRRLDVGAGDSAFASPAASAGLIASAPSSSSTSRPDSSAR